MPNEQDDNSRERVKPKGEERFVRRDAEGHFTKEAEAQKPVDHDRASATPKAVKPPEERKGERRVDRGPSSRTH